MAPAKGEAEPPAVIKKYPNRRLYNTETSVYITLEDLAEMVKKGQDFTVVDAKTGEDLTRQTLAQIIFEMEGRGSPLLPVNFLRSVIRMYDDNMQSALQHYLDASMQSWTSNQERIRTLTSRAMKDFSPVAHFEEMARQNMALFEKAFTMFTPFGGYFGEKPEKKK